MGDGKHQYFGTFESTNCDFTIANLDRLATGLQNQPKFRGFIIVYAGRISLKDEARKRGEMMRDFLVKYRGIDPQRIVALDGGYRERLTTELWLVQDGEEPPSPAPVLRPEGVKIKEGKIKHDCALC